MLGEEEQAELSGPPSVLAWSIWLNGGQGAVFVLNESCLPEKQNFILPDPRNILVLNQGQGTQHSI